MDCTDPRLLKPISEVFHFLKGPETHTEIHGKPIQKKLHRTGSRGASFTAGFLEVRLVFTPMSDDGDGRARGSDEGAAVFVSLPFRDEDSPPLQIQGYYSERNGSPRLTMNSPGYSKPSSGVQRVVYDLPAPTMLPPSRLSHHGNGTSEAYRSRS